MVKFRRNIFQLTVIVLIIALVYLLFFHAYVKEIRINVRLIGRGKVSINGLLVSSNSTLTFKLVKNGYVSNFEALTLEIKDMSSGGWRINEILFNNVSCSGNVVRVVEDGVIEVRFDRIVSIRYPDGSMPISCVDLDDDGICNFIIEINPWNLRSVHGYANMTYIFSKGMLQYYQEISDPVPVYQDILVFGFPEIYYGNKPWNRFMALDGPIPLPSKVINLNDFQLTLNYSLEHNQNLPINLAIESWFTREKYRVNGVFPGEIEMMIWLYWHNLSPAGSKIGELTIPLEVNGKNVMNTFEIWYANMTWHYIVFRIKNSIRNGFIRLDYSPFINEISNIIGNKFKELYLEDVEVGVEYGESSVRIEMINWRLYEFTLEYKSRHILDS
ncbi:MAG: hypothetical protein NDF56_07970 [archaeon GB-1845-036]|nr:hypothetical protein [Candidatus Culexmicrobium thermophilum]RLE55715.1 MAG: hypothetical protein DRJ30_03305 [Candidatus Verstraetearchaeota archaeon]